MNPTQIQNGLDFAAASSRAMKLATDEIAVHRSNQKAAADIASAVIGEMRSAGLLRDDANVKAAQVMLGSHPETVKLLRLVTKEAHDAYATIAELRAKLAAKQAGELGNAEGDDGPSAAPVHTSLNGPYIGGRPGEKKASDEVFRQVLRGG